jgi:hypothetical protein
MWKDLVGSGHDLILRYSPGIRLEGLRKTTKPLRIGGRRGRDLNPVPPEYEVGVLTTTTALDVLVRREVYATFWPGNLKDGAISYLNVDV